MMEAKSSDIETHELEMHQFDEDIRTALWGPVQKVSGMRIAQEGVIEQVKSLVEREQGKGLNARIATSDKILVVLLVSIAEAVRIVFG